MKIKDIEDGVVYVSSRGYTTGALVPIRRELWSHRERGFGRVREITKGKGTYGSQQGVPCLLIRRIVWSGSVDTIELSETEQRSLLDAARSLSVLSDEALSEALSEREHGEFEIVFVTPANISSTLDGYNESAALAAAEAARSREIRNSDTRRNEEARLLIQSFCASRGVSVSPTGSYDHQSITFSVSDFEKVLDLIGE